MIVCGLAYIGEIAARWTWYTGDEFGRIPVPSRRMALDGLDRALRDVVARGETWTMGPDIDLAKWLTALGRISEIPAPKATPKPKKQAPARGRR